MEKSDHDHQRKEEDHNEDATFSSFFDSIIDCDNNYEFVNYQGQVEQSNHHWEADELAYAMETLDGAEENMATNTIINVLKKSDGGCTKRLIGVKDKIQKLLRSGGVRHREDSGGVSYRDQCVRKYLVRSVALSVPTSVTTSSVTSAAEDGSRELYIDGSEEVLLTLDLLNRMVSFSEFKWMNGWFYSLSEKDTAEGKPDPCPLRSACGLKN
ncbi:hypothetical protein L484_009625 [Morus notabilis]|uniref:Uncharacterized protein n=1 Tax=Morus notabilis TaxID=981085 RepID=W9R4J8_9ROSA|nr:hypothetical protein L484_009625 [Morus notabilis]